MAPPPPRPPIICYDLQRNKKKRVAAKKTAKEVTPKEITPEKVTLEKAPIEIVKEKSISTPKTTKHFSFYKKDPQDNETLEVSELDFFEIMEDKTMLEATDLYNKMRSALNQEIKL